MATKKYATTEEEKKASKSSSYDSFFGKISSTNNDDEKKKKVVDYNTNFFGDISKTQKENENNKTTNNTSSNNNSNTEQFVTNNNDSDYASSDNVINSNNETTNNTNKSDKYSNSENNSTPVIQPVVDKTEPVSSSNNNVNTETINKNLSSVNNYRNKNLDKGTWKEASEDVNKSNKQSLMQKSYNQNTNDSYIQNKINSINNNIAIAYMNAGIISTPVNNKDDAIKERDNILEQIKTNNESILDKKSKGVDTSKEENYITNLEKVYKGYDELVNVYEYDEKRKSQLSSGYESLKNAIDNTSEDKDKSFAEKTADYATYLGIEYGLGAAGSLERTAYGVMSAVGDSLTKGEYSNDIKKLNDYFTSGKSNITLDLVSGGIMSSVQKNRIISETGVSLAALDAYLMANRSEVLSQFSEETLGITSDFQKRTGEWAKQLGDQTVHMLLTFGATEAEAVNMGASFAETIKAYVSSPIEQITSDLGLMYMSASAFGGNLYSNTVNSDNKVSENYINALLKAVKEYGTEKMGGITDYKSLERIFEQSVGDTTGKYMQKVAAKYAASIFDEIKEELVGIPIEAGIDIFTGYKDDITWFDEGGIFDLQEMANTAVDTAVTTAILGGSMFLGGIASVTKNGNYLKDAYVSLVEYNSTLPEQYRITLPESKSDIENITQKDIAVLEEKYLEALAKYYDDAVNGRLSSDNYSDPSLNKLAYPNSNTNAQEYTDDVVTEQNTVSETNNTIYENAEEINETVSTDNSKSESTNNNITKNALKKAGINDNNVSDVLSSISDKYYIDGFKNAENLIHDNIETICNAVVKSGDVFDIDSFKDYFINLENKIDKHFVVNRIIHEINSFANDDTNRSIIENYIKQNNSEHVNTTELKPDDELIDSTTRSAIKDEISEQIAKTINTGTDAQNGSVTAQNNQQTTTQEDANDVVTEQNTGTETQDKAEYTATINELKERAYENTNNINSGKKIVAEYSNGERAEFDATAYDKLATREDVVSVSSVDTGETFYSKDSFAERYEEVMNILGISPDVYDADSNSENNDKLSENKVISEPSSEDELFDSLANQYLEYSNDNNIDYDVDEEMKNALRDGIISDDYQSVSDEVFRTTEKELSSLYSNRLTEHYDGEKDNITHPVTVKSGKNIVAFSGYQSTNNYNNGTKYDATDYDLLIENDPSLLEIRDADTEEVYYRASDGDKEGLIRDYEYVMNKTGVPYEVYSKAFNEGTFNKNADDNTLNNSTTKGNILSDNNTTEEQTVVEKDKYIESSKKKLKKAGVKDENVADVLSNIAYTLESKGVNYTIEDSLNDGYITEAIINNINDVCSVVVDSGNVNDVSSFKKYFGGIEKKTNKSDVNIYNVVHGFNECANNENNKEWLGIHIDNAYNKYSLSNGEINKAKYDALFSNDIDNTTGKKYSDILDPYTRKIYYTNKISRENYSKELSDAKANITEDSVSTKSKKNMVRSVKSIFGDLIFKRSKNNDKYINEFVSTSYDLVNNASTNDEYRAAYDKIADMAIDLEMNVEGFAKNANDSELDGYYKNVLNSLSGVYTVGETYLHDICVSLGIEESITSLNKYIANNGAMNFGGIGIRFVLNKGNTESNAKQRDSGATLDELYRELLDSNNDGNVSIPNSATESEIEAINLFIEAKNNMFGRKTDSYYNLANSSIDETISMMGLFRKDNEGSNTEILVNKDANEIARSIFEAYAKATNVELTDAKYDANSTVDYEEQQKKNAEYEETLRKAEYEANNNASQIAINGTEYEGYDNSSYAKSGDQLAFHNENNKTVNKKRLSDAERARNSLSNIISAVYAGSMDRAYTMMIERVVSPYYEYDYNITGNHNPFKRAINDINNNIRTLNSNNTNNKYSDDIDALKKLNEYMRTERTKNVQKYVDSIKSYMSKYGIENIVVDEDDVLTNINGVYRASDNTIHVSPYVSSSKALVSTIVHEFTHHAATADMSLVNDVYNNVVSKIEYKNVNGRIKGFIDGEMIPFDVFTEDTYRKYYGNESDNDVHEEMVANFIGGIVGYDGNVNTNFADTLNGKHKNILRRIIDKIVDFANRLFKNNSKLSGGAMKAADELRSIVENKYGKINSSTKNGSDTITATNNDYGIELGNVSAKYVNNIDVKDKFSLDMPAERTKELLAIHNLDSNAFIASLKRGGLPAPSIAITKAELNPTEFGDGTIVFRKNTIDPEYNDKNTVYSYDAYTPTYRSPINEDKSIEIGKMLVKDYTLNYESLDYDVTNHKNTADSLAETLYNDHINRITKHYNNNVITASERDNLIAEIERDRPNYNGVEASVENVVLDNIKSHFDYSFKYWSDRTKLGFISYATKTINKSLRNGYIDANDISSEDVAYIILCDEDLRYSAYNDIANAYVRNCYKLAINKSVYYDKNTDILSSSKSLSSSEYSKILNYSVSTLDNSINREYAIKKLEDSIKESISQSGYDFVFDNNEYLQAVVDTMFSSQYKKGNGRKVFGYNVVSARQSLAKELSSINEIDNRANKLNDGVSFDSNVLNTTFDKFQKNILTTSKDFDSNIFRYIYNIFDEIYYKELIDITDENNFSDSNIKKHYNLLIDNINTNYNNNKSKYNIDDNVFNNYIDEIRNKFESEYTTSTKELIDYCQDNISGSYMEAKPARVVGTNEYAYAVIPDDDEWKEVRNELTNLGIKFDTYTYGDTSERLKLLDNQIGLKFNKSLGTSSTEDSSVIDELKNSFDIDDKSAKYLSSVPVKDKFSFDMTVERTPELLAVHNLEHRAFVAALKNGGIPAPSIAITYAQLNPNDFGEASIVFNKSSISPDVDSRNHVYGRDAYTPTYTLPKIKTSDIISDIGYDTEKLLNEVDPDKYVNISASIKKYIGDKRYITVDHESGMADSFMDEKTAHRLFNDEYNKDTSSIVYVDDDMIDNFASSIIYEVRDTIKDINNKYKIKHGVVDYDNSSTSLDSLLLLSDYISKSTGNDSTIEVMIELCDTLFSNIVETATNTMYSSSGINNFRPYVANDIISEDTGEVVVMPSSTYYDLLESTIKNKIDTNKSNPDLNDVVDAMYSYNYEKANGRKYHSSINAHDILQGTAKKYNSVDEIISDEDRLDILFFDNGEIVHNLESKLKDLISNIDFYITGSEKVSDYSDKLEYLSHMILDIADNNDYSYDTTRILISSYIDNWYEDFDLDDNDIYSFAIELKRLIDYSQNEKTEYFEAKPERVIRRNEFSYSIIPNTSRWDDVASMLDSYNIKYTRYDTEIDRMEALDDIDWLKFDKSVGRNYTEDKAAAEERGIDYNEYGNANIDAPIKDIDFDYESAHSVFFTGNDDARRMVKNNTDKERAKRFKNWLNKDGTIKVMSQQKLIDEYDTVLGTQRGLKHVHSRAGKHTAAFYDPYQDSVRHNKSSQLGYHEHETGHRLDHKLGLLSGVNMNDMQSIMSLRELINSDLARVIIATGYPDNEVPSECYAEFFRIWFDSRKYAEKYYPETVKYLYEKADDKTISRLEYLAELTNAYRTADNLIKQKSALRRITKDVHDIPVVSNIESGIEDFKEQIDSYRSNKEQFSNNTKKSIVDNISIEITNNIAPIKRVSEKGYNFARFTRAASSVQKTFLDDYTLDGNLNKTGAGLFTIARDHAFNLSDKELVSDFDIYMRSLVGLDIYYNNERKDTPHVFPYDKTDKSYDPNKQKNLEKTVAEMNTKHPDFKSLADDYYGYINRVLDFGCDMGVVSRSMLNELRKKYPHYVPTNRLLESIETQNPITKTGFADQRNPIKERTGSDRDIVEFFDNIATMTTSIVDESLKNRAMARLVTDVTSTRGNAYIMEQIEPDTYREVFSLAGVKERFEEEFGMDITRFSSTLSPDEQRDILDEFESYTPNILEKFITKELINQGKNVVTVLMGGKPYYYEVHDQALYDAVKCLGESTAHIPVLSLATTAFKMLNTGFKPSFMIRNMMMDSTSAVARTKTDTNYLFGGLTDWKRTIGASIEILFNSEEWQDYCMMGGEYGGLLNATYKGMSLSKPEGARLPKINESNLNLSRMRSRAASETKMLSEGKKIRNATMTNEQLQKSGEITAKYYADVFFDFAKRFADISDQARRFGEYKELKKSGETNFDSIIAAQEVTIDFSIHGNKTKLANQFVPYLNANVQSLASMKNYMTKENAARFVSRIAISNIIGAALEQVWNRIISGILFGDDDDDAVEAYNNLSNYVKNKNWCIYVGNKKFFKIPKANELNIIGSAMSRAVELYIDDNEDAFYQFGSYVFNLLPVYGVSDVSLIGTYNEIKNNETYTGASIIPSTLESVTPSAQYDEGTSPMAKMIGKTLNISPIGIDYFINNNLGFVGTFRENFYDKGNAVEAALYSFTKNFIADELWSNADVSKFYSDYDEIKGKSNAFDIHGAGDEYDYSDKYKYEKAYMLSYTYGKANSIIKDTDDEDAQRMLRNELVSVIDVYNKTGYTELDSFVMAVAEETGSNLSNIVPSIKAPLKVSALIDGNKVKVNGKTKEVELSASDMIDYYVCATSVCEIVYQSIYEDFVSGKLSTEEAANEMITARKNIKSQLDEYYGNLITQRIIDTNKK